MARCNVGDTITYNLRLSEAPVNPNKMWHGLVVKAWETCCRVQLLDEGYQGLQELVIGYQIVEVNEKTARDDNERAIRFLRWNS